MQLQPKQLCYLGSSHKLVIQRVPVYHCTDVLPVLIKKNIYSLASSHELAYSILNSACDIFFNQDQVFEEPPRG